MRFGTVLQFNRHIDTDDIEPTRKRNRYNIFVTLKIKTEHDCVKKIQFTPEVDQVVSD
jgi:hypothetical protein